MNEQSFKNMLDLFANPLFREGFAEFFFRAQQDGIEAARRFWDENRMKQPLGASANDVYARMMDFYSALGFVSKQEYDEVVRKKEQLAKENEVLKNTIRELSSKIYTEGTTQAQEIWKETVHKQMEMSTELAKSFFDLFKPAGGN